jgi:signal transduction histidine kinase
MLPPVNFRPPPFRARWLIVLVPTVTVAVLEEISDTFWDPTLPFPVDNLLVSGAVFVFSLITVRYAFRRIDRLTDGIRARNAELEARSASARALSRVSVSIAAESGLDHVLHAVVAYARELLEADVAVLLLESPDGGLVLRAADGLPPDGAVLRRATGPDAADTPDADVILGFVDPARAVARLSVPLQRGGSTIGVLAVGSTLVRGFDVDEVETLSSLASQAVLAIEHDRLEARLRELAVVDERERIARELHDGIAQVLGYVNTKSQAVDGYLEAGRIDEARVQLAELGSAARAVYVDVRESIVGLRGPIEPGQGLGAALAAHARRVAEASRFGLELAIEPATEAMRLDADAEANLYRIAQEALTNVRKHAGADRVRLATRLDGGQLTVSVSDNGRGLPPSGALDKPGYGLRAMRERASRIGATFQVMNQVGGGVLVRVVLPLAGHAPEVASDGTPASESRAAIQPSAASRGRAASATATQPAASTARGSG